MHYTGQCGHGMPLGRRCSKCEERLAEFTLDVDTRKPQVGSKDEIAALRSSLSAAEKEATTWREAHDAIYAELKEVKADFFNYSHETSKLRDDLITALRERDSARHEGRMEALNAVFQINGPSRAIARLKEKYNAARGAKG